MRTRGVGRKVRRRPRQRTGASQGANRGKAGARALPSDLSGAGALKPSSRRRRTSRCFNRVGGVWCHPQLTQLPNSPAVGMGGSVTGD